jgi:hypothetical protein
MHLIISLTLILYLILLVVLCVVNIAQVLLGPPWSVPNGGEDEDY